MDELIGTSILDRMVNAVEKVRQRLSRAAAALDRGGVSYAIAGGNAVAAWVATVDEAAVRNTQDVDILIRRSDLEAVKSSLAAAGFVYRHVAGMDVFLDGPNAKPRDAVHLVFANEKVRQHETLPNPDVTETENVGSLRALSLAALVQIKLTAFRDKDRVNLLDVGLIDATWLTKLPAELAARLQMLIDTPGG